MSGFKQLVLIFCSTALILFIGIVFGYDQIKVPEPVSAEILELAVPFEGDLDKEFLESLLPADE